MSSKTKIVVFHMKELIYTGIFIILGILFVILLAIMFLPEKGEKEDTNTTAAADIYVPGVYSTTLVLGNQTIDVEVIVDSKSIRSVQLKNLNDIVTTMYPLIQPSFDDISSQIEEKQSLDNITYSEDNKYTSLVLIDAIRTTLEKAASKEAQSGDGQNAQEKSQEQTQSEPQSTE